MGKATCCRVGTAARTGKVFDNSVSGKQHLNALERAREGAFSCFVLFFKAM